MIKIPIPTGGMLYKSSLVGRKYSMVWLHGHDGQFDKQGMGLQLAQGLEVPYDCYCFQNPNQGNYSRSEVNGFCDYIEKTNPDRLGLYVFGWSEGALGCFEFLNHHPEILTGVGFISGRTGLDNYADFVKINIRGYEGDQDNVLPMGSVVKFIQGVKDAGGNADIIIYKGQGHNIVDNAVSINNPEGTWQWMARMITGGGKVKDPEIVNEVMEIKDGKLIITTEKGTYSLQVTKE